MSRWHGTTGQLVYFAEACGRIKIGCSNDPEQRIRTVGEWIPFPITLLATIKGTYALESAIHRMFDAEWSHGEWFNPSARLMLFIGMVERGEPIPIDTTAVATRRKAFIADKKRIARKVHLLSPAVRDAFYATPKGIPIADDVMALIRAELPDLAA